MTAPTGDCFVGYYCSEGTSYPTTLCPVWFHCPAGVSAPLQCAAGTYQDQQGQGVCKVCPAGSYCDIERVMNTTRPLACPIGYYCLNGTTRSTPGSQAHYRMQEHSTTRRNCVSEKIAPNAPQGCIVGSQDFLHRVDRAMQATTAAEEQV